VTPGVYTPMLIFVLPPGAFICLGCIIAAFKKLTK
jgi:Na+-translocating ferredoxin:NAD+ oxidoreductase RnfE subunit